VREVLKDVRVALYKLGVPSHNFNDLHMAYSAMDEYLSHLWGSFYQFDILTLQSAASLYSQQLMIGNVYSLLMPLK